MWWCPRLALGRIELNTDAAGVLFDQGDWSMADTNEELVNVLTLAAATILGSLIQAKLTAQHNLTDAIDRSAKAALQLREKIQQTL
jgi:hypothetical protein